MPMDKRYIAEEGVNLIGNIQLGNLSKARKATKSIRSQFQGSSMAAMSSDSIMRFPVIMSASIGTEEAAQIAKAFERQYAVFVMIVLSSSLNISSDKYDTIQDYLRDLHNSNTDAPNLLDYAIGLTSNAVAMTSGFESVTVSEDELYKLWYGAESSVNMESLNNLYLPNNENMKKLSMVLESNSSGNTQKNTFQKLLNSVGNMNDGVSNSYPNTQKNDVRKEFDSKNRLVKTSVSTSTIPTEASPPRLIESRTLSSTEPTLVSAKIFVNNTSRDFIVGVKTMTRLCDSNTMIRELIKAVENTNLAFKIIKWTKGELKFFRDIVFGMTQAREDALNEKNGKGWFSAMRRRKQAAKTFIGGGRPLSPLNTIVCTKYELETVRAKTGIDLSEAKNARKLMKDLYLLGFCILDDANGTVEIMLDGDATDGEFAFNTVAGLRRMNDSSGGNVSLNDLRAFMKEVGSR